MKPLTTRSCAIVAYTRTGITRRLCGGLSVKLTPETAFYVEPQKKYAGPFGFLKGILDAAKNRAPVVYPPKAEWDLSRYDLVLVAGPVWAGRIASPLRSFLTQYGQGAKKTALLITHSAQDPCLTVFDELDGLLGVRRSFELSLCSIDSGTDTAVEEFGDKLLEALGG